MKNEKKIIRYIIKGGSIHDKSFNLSRITSDRNLMHIYLSVRRMLNIINAIKCRLYVYYIILCSIRLNNMLYPTLIVLFLK